MAQNLYCPQCSKPFSDGTSFCRTCGLSLGPISEFVNGDAAGSPTITSKPNFKVMRFGFGIFILGLVIGLLNGALRDFALFPESYGKLLFLGPIAIGMLTVGAGFVFPTKKYSKNATSPTSERDSENRLDTGPLAGQLSPADAHASLSGMDFFSEDRVPIDRVSVTEGTTRNLDVLDLPSK